MTMIVPKSKASYCENSLMQYESKKNPRGSFDFAQEGLSLEKAWRRCAQDGRDKYFV